MMPPQAILIQAGGSGLSGGDSGRTQPADGRGIGVRPGHIRQKRRQEKSNPQQMGHGQLIEHSVHHVLRPLGLQGAVQVGGGGIKINIQSIPAKNPHPKDAEKARQDQVVVDKVPNGVPHRNPPQEAAVTGAQASQLAQ